MTRTVKLAMSSLLALSTFVGGCGQSDTEQNPVPVIVDYSPTVSDVAALIYLLSNPNVDLLAITLPVTGEAGCDLGVEVTLGITAMFDRDDIPVACDQQRPTGANAWPAAFLGGNDALALSLPDPIAAVDPRPAPQLIVETVADSKQPVVLYAVAPLTNVARALDLDPLSNLKRIVIMGGAVDVPGNVPGTGAEWNLWIDVPAAARVLGGEIPITLVPLDATNDVPTPGLWATDVEQIADIQPAAYLQAMLQVFPASSSAGFYLWDELAAAVAAGEELTTTVEIPIVVAQDQGPDFGATRRDPSGRTVNVAVAVPDPEGFYSHFLSIIGGRDVDPRPTLRVTLDDQPTVDAASDAEEVLAVWLLAALAGDVESAESVAAADAVWPGVEAGLGESPAVFVEGSRPYGAFEVHLQCVSAGETALCDGAWNDLWLDANQEVDAGRLRVRAEVIGGEIISFDELSFSADVAAALESHLSWLATNQPDALRKQCGPDSASIACSQLLVDTATSWTASR